LQATVKAIAAIKAYFFIQYILHLFKQRRFAKSSKCVINNMKRRNYDIIPEDCEDIYMIWFW